jgi:drug/metabolite transporter (DMT)-like permease
LVLVYKPIETFWGQKKTRISIPSKKHWFLGIIWLVAFSCFSYISYALKDSFYTASLSSLVVFIYGLFLLVSSYYWNKVDKYFIAKFGVDEA